MWFCEENVSFKNKVHLYTYLNMIAIIILKHVAIFSNNISSIFNDKINISGIINMLAVLCTQILKLLQNATHFPNIFQTFSIFNDNFVDVLMSRILPGCCSKIILRCSKLHFQVYLNI